MTDVALSAPPAVLADRVEPAPPTSDAGTVRPASALPDDPPGATAAAILGQFDAERGVLVVADGERRAVELAGLMRALAPERDVMVFPGWDCLPHDRVPPSAAVSGCRAAVLHRLAARGADQLVVVAAPDALVQRVPVASADAFAPLRLKVNDALDVEALVKALQALGYWDDERVDEPGEYSANATTFDIFPAQLQGPVRIAHEGGIVTAIRAYDPVSQRSLRDLAEAEIGCAREVPETGSGQHPATSAGPRRFLVEAMPGATVVLASHARDRALGFLDTVRDAATPLTPRRRAGAIASAADLYGDAAALEAFAAGAGVVTLSRMAAATVPRFATDRQPARAFKRFLMQERRAGRTVVVSAPDGASLRRALRMAGRAAGVRTRSLSSLAEAADLARALENATPDTEASAPGRSPTPRKPARTARPVLPGLVLPATRGFRDPAGGLTVVTGFDLLGSRAVQAERGRDTDVLPDASDWQVGDAVVDIEHGLARLGGLESVSDPAGVTQDVIRLVFAHDEAMLLPVAEAGRLWRYGSAGTDRRLDTLHTSQTSRSAWQQRRDVVAAEIAITAARLAREAEERRSRRAPPVTPPPDALERFAARFPYVETPDQAAAIAEVLDDLASGRPMDRLVCGDVGFGKTEVALRAAAAVALAGRQVALVAPTTILARQHLKTVRQRFAGFGIAVAELSRFVPAAEAKAVRQGLADGRISVVVGTHAVAGKDVAFADLGLMIVDEEQRFGEAQKKRLRQQAEGRHLLTMTATPIPRTLQTALAGLRDLSRIATPPVARRPVRTTLEPFTPALVAEALERERNRGGQSFLVCPRIEDLEPVRAMLARACPDLSVVTAHAQMPANDLDEVMLAFAEGDGDCLLTTSIVESGLDVPNANTMLVAWPDRFGLAQLHQLRGRVGRGRAAGFCLLLTPPDKPLPEAAQRRLQTLAALDHPGAGFAISTRDLDLRGAGDLFGEDQTGHMSVVGSELARHLAEVALRRARGERVDDQPVEIAIADRGSIPEAYVTAPEERLSFYVRLARATDVAGIDALGDELEDRFGPRPATVERWLSLAGLQVSLRQLGLVRLDVGPQGLAATPAAAEGPPAWIGPAERRLGGAPLLWHDGRIAWRRPGEAQTDVARACAFLKALSTLASGRRQKRQPDAGLESSRTD